MRVDRASYNREKQRWEVRTSVYNQLNNIEYFPSFREMLMGNPNVLLAPTLNTREQLFLEECNGRCEETVND